MTPIHSQFPIHVDSDFVRFGNTGPSISIADIKTLRIKPAHLDLMVNGWHRFAADTNFAGTHPLLPMQFRPNDGLYIKTKTPWYQDNDDASFEIQLLSAWEVVQDRALRIKPGDHLLLAGYGTSSLKILVKALG